MKTTMITSMFVAASALQVNLNLPSNLNEKSKPWTVDVQVFFLLTNMNTQSTNSPFYNLFL